MTETQPLPRLTLSRQIRDALVRRIVSGELQPGERLIETRIAESYGTSQAPVREALRELETIGLVETKPRRGTFVRHFIQQTLRESYVVRAALEEAATRLALPSGTLPFDALRADVAALHDAARRGDVQAVGAASVSFHRHVIDAAHNELLKNAWEALQIEARTAATLVAVEPDLDEVANEHEELLNVLLSGDLDAACQLTRDHQWHYADLPHDAHGRTRL
ncbi:DNA-binding GntR family transcriptional regulator [Kibdelosporangium banguiense]|uniref:DNA-binding GntR family transcriptional regulator n=1 Tax=Kibdelosporangium banguiense TaxID=1365924 RepID=A0ABS4TTP2_9PSEU|nr:GntR family transcriptional regulator [Kibdelosporangium banguiense]MBP2327784.1 DNA-binding GntR family transcriptional regulator [Kibdelosporangium banguiense]